MLAPAAAPAAVILTAKDIATTPAGGSGDGRAEDAAAAKGGDAGAEKDPAEWALTLAALGAIGLALRPRSSNVLPQAF
jgi:hypothetical protein